MGPVKYVNDSARRSVEFDFCGNRSNIMFMSESQNAIITMASAAGAPVSEVPSHAPVFTERAAEHEERADVKVAANDNRGGIIAMHRCTNAVIANVHAHEQA